MAAIFYFPAFLEKQGAIQITYQVIPTSKANRFFKRFTLNGLLYEYSKLPDGDKQFLVVYDQRYLDAEFGEDGTVYAGLCPANEEFAQQLISHLSINAKL